MKIPPANSTGKTEIPPFEVAQALVALELADTDGPVFKFFDFFSEQVPVKAAYFVHVLPKIDFFDEEVEKNASRGGHPYEIDKKVLEDIEFKINDILPSGKAVHIQYDVKEGDPLEEILTDSEDISADLVVVGQRAETEAHGVLAKNLIRKVKGNALIVPSHPKTTIKNILIPIDFSANAVRALHAGIALQKRLDEPVNLICLNVYEMPNLSVYKIGKTREQLKHMMEEDRNNAFKAFLHSYAGDMEDKIQTVLVEKDLPGISRYIFDYAEDNAIDFIVMGAKGHSKVDLLLMGSITEKLLTLNDKIPTLVVK